MSDERKKYDVTGTVTISTEEYRDLIEDRASFEKDMSDYRSRYWDEQGKRKEAEKKVETLTKTLEKWKAFLADHETVRVDWLNYAYGGNDDEE